MADLPFTAATHGRRLEEIEDKWYAFLSPVSCGLHPADTGEQSSDRKISPPLSEHFIGWREALHDRVRRIDTWSVAILTDPGGTHASAPLAVARYLSGEPMDVGAFAAMPGPELAAAYRKGPE